MDDLPKRWWQVPQRKRARRRVASLWSVTPVFAILLLVSNTRNAKADEYFKSTAETVPLHVGGGYAAIDMPALVLGTFGLDDCEATIDTALALGYRHFDTAPVYSSERCVGNAVRRALSQGVIAERDAVFITTKVPGSVAAAGIAASARLSRDALGLDYIDLLLVHWPSGTAHEREAVWRAMQAVHGSGVARAIGISNFDAGQLQDLLELDGVQPSVNQVELNPREKQIPLRRLCASSQVVLVAYTPFGEPPLLKAPAVVAAARETGMTPAMVLLWWVRFHVGAVAVFKTSRPDRLVENAVGLVSTLSDEAAVFAAPELQALSEESIRAIDTLSEMQDTHLDGGEL